ncbi:MAG: hypothetical protein JJU29_19305 [Verrucomicrobia bacterium]|nr:hypothetical protein [Verrucomicrobiota bacterium]
MKKKFIILRWLLAILLVSCTTRSSQQDTLLRELERTAIHMPFLAFEGEHMSSYLKHIENLINAELDTPISFKVFDHSGRKIPLKVQPLPPPGFPRMGGVYAHVPDVMTILSEMGLKYELDEQKREIIFRQRIKDRPPEVNFKNASN